jgi:carboxylesterase type B
MGLLFNTNQSEDCLTINVFTPPNTNAGSKKPVMLWIYGGAFTIGDGGMAAFDPVQFVNNQDLIVVTFNYRVNLFGFPGAPGLEHLNPGLLDQRLATEWVRDNIAVFGGDPGRITAFGESAGGSSVDFYAYVYPNDPIVAGLIAQSGAATGNGVGSGVGLIRRVNDHRAWYSLSKKLGCGGEEAGAATLACAKRKTLNEVSSAGVGGFGPWVDNKTVFADVMDRARDGQFMKVVSLRKCLLSMASS